MSWVLQDAPFFDHETRIAVGQQEVFVRAFQVVVWISLEVDGQSTVPIPAVLDTGHSHFFSIGQSQFEQWTAMDNPPKIGRVRVNGRPIDLVGANLSIVRNVPGDRDRLLNQATALDLPQGIAMHSLGDPFAPRLPLLGLRALAHNRLRTVVDGAAMMVSIERSINQ